MAIVLTLGRSDVDNMRVWATKWKTRDRKVCFYDEMASEWDFGSSSEIIVSLGVFNGHVGKCAKGFEGIREGNVLGKEIQKIARVL